MAEIGYITLFLALLAALYSAFAFIFGARGKHPVLIHTARNSLLAVCGLVTISIAILVYALVSHNFQIEYVALYTNRDLSLIYRLSALWAGNDGSLLFWAWLLTVFGTVAILLKRNTGKELIPYASAIIMITEAFFLIILLWVANPFHKLPFVPADGQGLNPLLENPGMIVHPPLLLAGYVGFTVPFAFAMAALLTRRLGDEWIKTARKWTLIPWIALGLGNLFGAWWAYVELGWGGYWAWDPVENAGILPWLFATAFLHSIMMQRRRGILKVWNMVLIILTFTLSIFGTFLTRSGILSSVHDFGESPLLGNLFLSFIIITLIGSFGLLFYRKAGLKSEAEMESFISRESTFLLNNLLLVGAAFAIFLGTVFPVISEAVRGTKISVGAPFFNQVNGPIFLAIIALMGICALIGWRRASGKNLVRNFLWPLIGALVLGTVLFVFGVRQWYALIALFLTGFVLFTTLFDWLRATGARRRIRGGNYLKAFWGLTWANRPRYGGYIVHIAILLIAIGVIGSTFYSAEAEAVLTPGESMTVKNYTITYEDMDFYETQSKTVVTSTVSVYNEGHFLGTLNPEKYFHQSYNQPVTEVAIRSTLAEDLYVILAGQEVDGTAAFKVLVNPLVNWIWIGGIVLVIGGIIVFWPERQQPPAQAQTQTGR